MQTQLNLNDVRPRPRIHSAAVIDGAVQSFLLANELSLNLLDFSASDEEWLREIFAGTVTAATSTDAWAMASAFADKMSDVVCEDYVELFDGFVSHLSDWQEQIQVDWIDSGGAVNPIRGGVARITVATSDGVIEGLGFNDARYAKTGRFTFLADRDRATSISADGEITRRRVLEWEMIRSSGDAAPEDLDIHARDEEIRSSRERRSREQQLRMQAERQRNALLAENPVNETEAAQIFAGLELPDDASAARVANAILATLSRRYLERLD